MPGLLVGPWWICYTLMETAKGGSYVELMVILFLLVLINLLLALGRTQHRKWLRHLLTGISFMLLLVTILFVLRMFL